MFGRVGRGGEVQIGCYIGVGVGVSNREKDNCFGRRRVSVTRLRGGAVIASALD